MMGRRGLTIMELMVALIITGFVVIAATSAYSMGFNMERQTRESQERHESRIQFEDRLRRLLTGIYVTPTDTDTTTYMLGEVTGNSSDAISADMLTFTSISDSVNSAQLGIDTDFETSNQSLGPQGGVAEIAISTAAVGEAGQNKQGLFVRIQRPSDGDPTQGGSESVFDEDIASISFEFYNGEDWETTWGTSGLSGLSGSAAEVSGQNGRRIPAAIRVTYSRTSDPNNTQLSFVVRLPQSDVTSQNPSIPGETATP
jgi:Tfp pilus assembly protein PilE